MIPLNLPFAPGSPFGQLLVKTWRRPEAVVDGSWSKSAAHVLGLNAYSILHDRRIPANRIQELEIHYEKHRAARKAQNPEGVVREFIKNYPPRAADNEMNRVEVDRPDRVLLSAVPMSRRLLAEIAMDAPEVGMINVKEMEKSVDALGGEMQRGDPVPNCWQWLINGDWKPQPVSKIMSNPDFPGFVGGLNRARGKRPLMWIADEDDLAKVRHCCGWHDAQDARGWAVPLGLHHTVGEIYLVFRFPAVEVGLTQLYRPHHLDAGFYREHYPSPVSHRCGYTMHLDEATHNHLVREFVHSPIDLLPRHLHTAAITRASSGYDDITKWRRMHWSRLNGLHCAAGAALALAVELFPEHGGQTQCTGSPACACHEGYCREIWPKT